MNGALHSRRVLLPEGEREATLYWREGRIIEIRSGYDVTVESAGDRVLMPGVIDPHVHLNEPGRAHWEGFESGTRAAAAGGITTVVDMPLNSEPVTCTADALALKRDASEGKRHVHVGFHGGVVPDAIAAVPALLDGGVFALKAFLVPSGLDAFPAVGESELRAVAPMLRARGMALWVHAEMDGGDGDQAALARQPRSHAAWLASRPSHWEDDAVRTVLRIAADTGVRVHIVHVASPGVLPLLASARAAGIAVTAETCPHYLTFCAEDIPDGAVAYKCAPPIRGRAVREALWAALASGQLDWVASDHSPAPPDVKQIDRGDFSRAWGGIAGLQLLLPAVWSMARTRGHGLAEVARWLCRAPAKALGLRAKGVLEVGADADLVLWDPDEPWRVSEALLEHRHKATPWLGRELHGVVHRTWVAGTLAFADGRVTSACAGEALRRGEDRDGSGR